MDAGAPGSADGAVARPVFPHRQRAAARFGRAQGGLPGRKHAAGVRGVAASSVGGAGLGAAVLPIHPAVRTFQRTA